MLAGIRDFLKTATLLMLVSAVALGAPDCGSQRGTPSVAVGGMPFLVPQQARIGAIHQADTRLPQLLVAAFNDRGRYVALDYSHLDLRALTAPRGMFTGHLLDSDLTWRRVERPEADYVLTGVIENVDFGSDRSGSVLARFARRSLALLSERYNQPRRIALVLEVYDAASDELVMQKRYLSEANWDFPRGVAPGIDSPRIWQSAYGRELARVAERAVADVEEAMQCAALARVDSPLPNKP